MANASSWRRRVHVKISRSEISAGDHIYTPRALGVYDHHGIYIGEGKVIHFQNSLDDKALGSGSSIPRHGRCLDCGHHSERSGVVKSCLNCFLRGGIIYRYEYGCRGGRFISIDFLKWCTSADSDPPQTVIDRAEQLERTNGFGEYNLVRKNCEDFALFCKTGQHFRNGQSMIHIYLPHWILLSICASPLLHIVGVSRFAILDGLRQKPRRIWNWLPSKMEEEEDSR